MPVLGLQSFGLTTASPWENVGPLTVQSRKYKLPPEQLMSPWDRLVIKFCHPSDPFSLSLSPSLSLALPLSEPLIGVPSPCFSVALQTTLTFTRIYTITFEMFAKSTLLVALFFLTPFTMSREVFLERDGKIILSRILVPRRFGQEQCGGLPQQIGAACRGEVCGVLGGKSSTYLNVNAPRDPILYTSFQSAPCSLPRPSAASKTLPTISLTPARKKTPSPPPKWSR